MGNGYRGGGNALIFTEGMLQKRNKDTAVEVFALQVVVKRDHAHSTTRGLDGAISMRRYSETVKAEVKRRMGPPQRQSVAQISKEFGIHDATLYNPPLPGKMSPLSIANPGA